MEAILRYLFMLMLALTLTSCVHSNKGNNLNLTVIWKGNPNYEFNDLAEKAINQLNDFVVQNNLAKKVDSSLIKQVIHFESKELFDIELKDLSGGKIKKLPRTYVALAEGQVLRVVSWEAYRQIHPNHNIEEYVKLLQHEIAHIFHSQLAGDDGMGPVWFFEGFAVVAANQYSDEPSLSDSQISKIVNDDSRGDYKKYGSIIRSMMKKHKLKNLLQVASASPDKLMSHLGFEKED